jgi:hypothetical protein
MDVQSRTKTMWKLYLMMRRRYYSKQAQSKAPQQEELQLLPALPRTWQAAA